MILEGAQAALALAPIAFAGGFIQGITGFGSALITIPLATFFVPLPFALAVFAVVDFANGLRLGLENPRNAVLGDIARMVPLMIVGIVTGTTLLVNLPRNASLIALGTLVGNRGHDDLTGTGRAAYHRSRLSSGDSQELIAVGTTETYRHDGPPCTERLGPRGCLAKHPSGAAAPILSLPPIGFN